MEREVLVKKLIGRIEQLPTNRIHEVNDFMKFIINRANDSLITRELQQLALSGNTFDFLDKEPDLYTINDLKVRFA